MGDSSIRKRRSPTAKRRSFWLRRGSAARGPWRRHDVRISRVGRRLFDAWIHLFRMDDAVRLVELFAQVLGRRSRLGARSVLTWSRVERRRWSWRCGRLGARRAGDKGDAGDQ
jgi:hypothetical protein